VVGVDRIADAALDIDAEDDGVYQLASGRAKAFGQRQCGRPPGRPDE
jgi:hypothetical protein